MTLLAAERRASRARPQAPIEFNKQRVAGRVHALVRPPKRAGLSTCAIRPALSGGSNARHHPPAHILAGI
ncbi:MAG: hypothetical protein M3362_01545 [Acidobacteriota bacterium]|nr:hypothetical protein [Acidobacteriota bacterium]